MGPDRPGTLRHLGRTSLSGVRRDRCPTHDRLLSGSVELRVPFGDEQLPATRVEAGDSVGQTSLTREVVQTFQIARNEVAVLVVPVEAIDTIVRSSPQLARDFGAVIDRRHQDVADAIAARAAQATHSVTSR